MSLLDFGRTPAWTAVRIDYGRHLGEKTRWKWTEARWLDNGPAIAWANTFPVGSKLVQWNGRFWADVMTRGPVV